MAIPYRACEAGRWLFWMVSIAKAKTKSNWLSNTAIISQRSMKVWNVWHLTSLETNQVTTSENPHNWKNIVTKAYWTTSPVISRYILSKSTNTVTSFSKCLWTNFMLSPCSLHTWTRRKIHQASHPSQHRFRHYKRSSSRISWSIDIMTWPKT